MGIKASADCTDERRFLQNSVDSKECETAPPLARQIELFILYQPVKSADTTPDPETYAIIGAGMEVHRHLGHGFLEAVYQEALQMELTARMIPFQREVALPITFKA